jgi:ABC-type proline/glycine betaine transport system permease subunit
MNPLKDLISFINQHVKECGIIYCRTKNQVDELVDQLKRENIESVGFHSSKSNNERKSIQESWIKGDVPIIIATVSFLLLIIRLHLEWELTGRMSGMLSIILSLNLWNLFIRRVVDVVGISVVQYPCYISLIVCVSLLLTFER